MRVLLFSSLAVLSCASWAGVKPTFRSFQHSPSVPRPSSANCTEKWHTQTLDHFSWLPGPENRTTFQQRVFFCDVPNAKPAGDSCPPVLFYTGNEGDVELYVNQTGLMWEHAAELGVQQLVFAEHRFFGRTQPFGEDFPMDPEHMRYLSVSQVLADYASLLFELKRDVWQCEAPVVTVGGSYGGMLSTWLRIKYPAAVAGAVAGSAPIWAFKGLNPPVDFGYFAAIETYDASAEGLGSDECVDSIRAGWEAVFRLSASASGRATVSRSMALCEALNTTQDGANLAGWASNGLSYVAMGSYPFPSSYMLNGNGVLPPYPMQEVCRRMLPAAGHPSDEVLLSALGNALGVWFNYTNDLKCYDWTAGAPNKQTQIDGMLWDYLACTALVMPMNQSGTTDMFWRSPWDEAAYAASCREQWGVSPRPLWPTIDFGGKNPAAFSNIFFSSGEYDPWRGADVTVPSYGSVQTAIVQRAGHHMDLMFAQPQDNLTNVAEVRQQEVDAMRRWIAQAYASQ